MIRALRTCMAVMLPLVISLLTASPLLADGPWATAQSIDVDNEDSTMPAVAVEGSDVLAVWIESTDNSTGTFSIQSNRSADGGETWAGTTLVSNDSLYYCTDLRMAMSGANAVAVWYDVVEGMARIRCSYSSDKGATWSSPVSIDDAATNSAGEPDVAIDGSNVLATWKESDGSGNVQIVANRSSDGGATWEGSQSIDFDYGEVDYHQAEHPNAVIQGQNAVVGWKTSFRESGVYYHQVYANSSDDGGETWDGAQLLSSGTESYAPKIAMAGSTVVAIWNDNGGNTSIYSNRSSDGGETWSGVHRLDNGAVGGKYSPAIDVSDSGVVAVWTQYNDMAYVAWSNCSDDGGTSWGTAKAIDTSVSTDMYEPQVALSGSTAVALWYHNDGTDQRVYSSYSTDGGSTWEDSQRVQGDVAIRAGWPRIAMSGSRAVAVWQQFDTDADIYTNYFEEPKGVALTLKAGNNMVSVPVEADDMSPSALFGEDAVVREWNPVTHEYSTPATIVPKNGYSVTVPSDKSLWIPGEPVIGWTTSLSQGWNLIGSTHGEATPLTNLNETPADAINTDTVYWWNPSTGQYEVASQIEEGKAHWVVASEACSLTVGSPPA